MQMKETKEQIQLWNSIFILNKQKKSVKSMLITVVDYSLVKLPKLFLPLWCVPCSNVCIQETRLYSSETTLNKTQITGQHGQPQQQQLSKRTQKKKEKERKKTSRPVFLVGMVDIGFFASIWYAITLQLIWSITNSDTDVYFFPLHQITEIIKSLL